MAESSRDPDMTGSDAGGFDETMAHAAVAAADANALRLALYQQTREPTLAAMMPQSRAVRGGGMVIQALAADDRDIVLRHALDWLRSPTPPAPAPDDAEAEELLRLFGAAPADAAATRLAIEELGFAADNRATRWDRRPEPASLAAYDVTIVGAGISGIAVALRLTELGFPVTVIERRSDIGGTWLWNDYPGARVDVGTAVYQFKFERDHCWARPLATQPEILAYLQDFVARRGLRRHMRFGVEVTAACWDEQRGCWRLTLCDAQGGVTIHETRFVISAAGVFNTARQPDIDGIEHFGGEIVHTTAWSAQTSVTGKLVGLVGTGSSGAQLMPYLAQEAAQLTVFQRTPNWVVPMPGHDAPYPPGHDWLVARLPGYRNWHAYAALLIDRQIEPLQERDPAWVAAGGFVNERNDALRRYLEQYVQQRFHRRPDLIAASLPVYPPAARRIVVDNGWYDTLLRPNVRLVTDRIASVERYGVNTVMGARYQLDTLVLASGFDTDRYLSPVDYRGRNGVPLSEIWEKDGARAYLGMTIAGYPNLFVMYGPNGQPRAGGFHAWTDMWSRYIAKLMIETVQRGATAVEVRADASDAYNNRLDVAMDRLIWGSQGAGSYYLNTHGRSAVNMPWSADAYFAMVETPHHGDYDYRGSV